MSPKEICDRIVKVFANKTDVVAILNNGSSVVGMDTPSSDLDFVIILKDNKNEKKLLEILRRKFGVLKNEDYPEIEVEEQFDIGGRRADFTFISKKDIERKVNNFYKSKDAFLESQHFMKHKIVGSVAIYDSDKLLPKWKKKVEKYPRKIMKEIFDSQIYLIKEELFYWENHGFRNEFQFGFEQWDLIKGICQALYAKNNQMFMLPYKRVHSDLKKLKPNIEKEMCKLIMGTNNSRMIRKKIELVKQILVKLEK